MPPYPIPLRRKVFFWILLGALSTYFAECIAGSTLFPFTTGNGLLIVFPVYCLHAVVLSAIVYRFRPLHFEALYFAGTIFGMYEAYITKVLWTSSSPEGPLARLGGVSALDFLVVVLFWHPLMGFVIPVTLAERLLTVSRSIRFSGFQGKVRGWIIFAILCGANQGLSWLWMRSQENACEFQDVLPSGGELKVLCGILLALYALFTFRYRADKLPGTGPQLTILGIYVVLTSLLVFYLRHRRATTLPVPGAVSLKLLAWIVGAATFSSAVVTTILGILGVKTATFLLVLVLCALAGLIIFIWLVARTFRLSHTGAKVPSAVEAG
jgi:hypothetical protein